MSDTEKLAEIRERFVERPENFIGGMTKAAHAMQDISWLLSHITKLEERLTLLSAENRTLRNVCVNQLEQIAQARAEGWAERREVVEAAIEWGRARDTLNSDRSKLANNRAFAAAVERLDKALSPLTSQPQSDEQVKHDD